MPEKAFSVCIKDIVFIDPPYNTGNDFVYNDDYSMSQEESDIAEGVVDELGERYTKNQKSTNKFHARWLNERYPRLKLAKDLLTDDDVIFISMDDNEIDNLKNCVMRYLMRMIFVVNICGIDLQHHLIFHIKSRKI